MEKAYIQSLVSLSNIKKFCYYARSARGAVQIVPYSVKLFIEMEL